VPVDKGRLGLALRLTCKFIYHLGHDEGGQSTVEYILILSASVVGAAQLGRAILRALDNGILKLGGDLEKDLKTGRAPLNVWEN
jgi:hypothetical protein